jgi:soluble lytic murein transglycosylase-like protein
MKRFFGIVFLCLVAGLVIANLKTDVKPVSAALTAPNATSYQDMARQEATAAGIPPDLFVNQINQESGFNPNAHGGSGEIGIAQFMPETARGLGIDPADPHQALHAAAQLMARYYQANEKDYAKALAGYNCGGGCLAHAVRVGGEHWGCQIPQSTRQYIWLIMSRRVC